MNTTPPDIRLAKAFQFTMDDLLANRAGVLSWRQRGLSDRIAHRISSGLRRLPIVGTWLSNAYPPKKSPYAIQTLCGRIQLEHYVVDRRLDRSTIFYEYYHLVFAGHDRYFVINRQQYEVLTENLTYRVYYQLLGEEKPILSIERIIGRCDEPSKRPL